LGVRGKKAGREALKSLGRLLVEKLELAHYRKIACGSCTLSAGYQRMRLE
jgi:hypothetical protein